MAVLLYAVLGIKMILFNQKEEGVMMVSNDFEMQGDVLVTYKGNAQEIVVPEGVTEIAASAFEDCACIRTLAFPNTLKKIGDHAFKGAYMLGELVIPDSVVSVGYQAFYGCACVERVVIGRSLKEIENGAFAGLQFLKEIVVDEENPHFKSLDGCLYTKNGDTLIQFPTGKIEFHIVVPDGVKFVSDHAFFMASHILSVTLPESVISVGREAFQYCKALCSVTMLNPDTKIGIFTFDSCEFLQTVKRGKT